MAHLSEQLKAKGNDAFRQGEYAEAEDLYSQAIQKNATNPLLFTNRANVRLKLHKWEEAVLDCNKAIEITGEGAPNHKAYYFLGEQVPNQDSGLFDPFQGWKHLLAPRSFVSETLKQVRSTIR
jgi:tetratricopeptide (TPR) repeat protein